MKIYNSLYREKQTFVPHQNKRIRMYVCGITPNNATHLGHAFTYVSFDVLIRYLTHKGYTVTYLQNATDVNDSEDVIQQAKETGKTWNEIADFWIKHFHENMDKLNVIRPTQYVKASSAISTIIEINTSLIKKGVAYIKGGNVYFDISKFKEYGNLSKFAPDQMLLLSKERGNNPDDPNKRNPLDFVLWFGSNESPNWESPWGKGRPGWHIECSAMIYEYLGEQIDIHGGGRDLIFPHHESEISQSETYTGKTPYVKCWMHTGMVLYEGEKMSKSLGNLVLISDLLKKYSPNAIRWLLLCHYWRQPWEFSEDELDEAEKKVELVQKALNTKFDSKTPVSLSKFERIMDEDLYTPRVLEWIFALAEKIVYKKTGNPELIRAVCSILGFKL